MTSQSYFRNLPGESLRRDCWFVVSLLVPLVLSLLASPCLAQSMTLKIATLAPDGSTWLKEARKGAAEIARRTSGRVTLRFYPGGSMGDEEAVLRKIRFGQLHGSAMTSGTLAGLYPDIQILSLPLLFSSYEEVDRVRSRIDQRLIASLAEQGMISFGLIEGGFAYLLSGEEIRSIGDLNGRKAWLREGDIIGQAVVEAAGLAPIPLPLSDVLMGLQTGLIDTVAGPPVAAVALQWFTKVKYLTDLPLIYTYGTIVIGDKALRRVSPEDRTVVSEELGKVCERLDRAGRKENEAALEALTKQGVVVVNASEAMLQEWSQLAAKATQSLIDKGTISRQMHTEIVAILEEQPAAASSGGEG